jgi:hypothetical protein
VAAEQENEAKSIEEQIDSMPATGLKLPSFVTKMPPIVPKEEEETPKEEETMVDISEVAVNPFVENAMKYRPIAKPKEEFKETILENDYKEEMDLKEDSSESVDDSFLDF